MNGENRWYVGARKTS